jgi:hypothetical protein
MVFYQRDIDISYTNGIHSCHYRQPMLLRYLDLTGLWQQIPPSASCHQMIETAFRSTEYIYCQMFLVYIIYRFQAVK